MRCRGVRDIAGTVILRMSTEWSLPMGYRSLCSGGLTTSSLPSFFTDNATQHRDTAQYTQIRWASKKQGGSTQNNKDSNPKFLGIKLFGGEHCIPGNIIVRQRGKRFHPGVNVGIGKDHTLFSLVEGNVCFTKDRKKNRTYVHVK